MTSRRNPFDDEVAVQNSNYCVFDDGNLVRPGRVSAPSEPTCSVHGAFRSLALHERFTCVGAKSAVRLGGYAFGLYDTLGSPASAAGLAHDLFTFVTDPPAADGGFLTYIASFTSPAVVDEEHFEGLLWRTLQQLHDRDAVHHEWDHDVSDEPSDPGFSFSFAETGFFVVGLHAASSRVARRFPWPTLAFNPHRQFGRLREAHQFERFRDVIRAAERRVHGTVNPMVADFAERSEASQYSGREVPQEWRCPFSRRHRPDASDPPTRS